MKKLLLIFLVIVSLAGCKEPKGYVTLSGKIENADTKEIEIISKTFIKTIVLNDDGTFKDTLKVEKGIYTFTDGINKSLVFLANGYDLKIAVDATDFADISFDGKGKESNNYILEKINFSKTDFADPKSYFTLERSDFDARVEALKKHNNEVSKENVDSLIVAQIETDNSRFIEYIEKNYELKYASLIKFARGKPSPKFTNLENYNGSTTSLDDLKGKYVYIDVWATWCGPCKVQIPYLKKTEKEYEHKNIVFVSISTDRQNKHKAWKKMIEDREMGGIQLFAGDDYSFSTEYNITGIPRFILVDPDGNIVDADAPRPSDPKLKTLFDSLNI